MKKRQIFAFMGGLVATFILAASIELFAPSPVVAQSDTKLLVSAAISLKDSLEEIKPTYQKTNPKVTITYNFGSSGALQQQIENGAPADIFFSAAQKQMDALDSKRLILKDTRRNLLNNRLVLVVPKKSSGITSFRDLTDPKVKKIAIGEPRSVPAGQYAEEVLKKLEIWDRVKPKLVLGNNVRQVLAFVESGNADVGVVYLTDAKTSNQVKEVATAADNLHSPIVYSVAVLKDRKNPSAARKYVQFLSSDRAKNVFEKCGYKMAEQQN